jgi:uncharacterized protein YyaL (SSP411 family)
LFLSETGQHFCYSSINQTDVPIRKIDVYDGAQPSSNAVMAEILFLSGEIFGRNDWIDQSFQMLGNMTETVHRYARSFGYWALLMQRLSAQPKQVVFSELDQDDLLKQWAEQYFPEVGTWVCHKDENEIPLLRDKFNQDGRKLYLCYQSQCLEPVDSLEQLVLEIKKIK